MKYNPISDKIRSLKNGPVTNASGKLQNKIESIFWILDLEKNSISENYIFWIIYLVKYYIKYSW